jgi:long-chain acyl-CoA synthetase
LHALGLSKGDKIATILPNCLEQLELDWTVAKTGTVAVPMRPLLTEADLVSLLQNCDAKLVLSTAALAKTLANVRAEVATIDASRWVMTSGAARIDDVVGVGAGNIGEPKGIVHTHSVRGGYATRLLGARYWRRSQPNRCRRRTPRMLPPALRPEPAR